MVGWHHQLSAHEFQQTPGDSEEQETWVRPLGWKDPLEKGKATHCSILTWRIPWIIQPAYGVTESHMTKQLFHFHFQFSSVQSVSLVRLFATP